jgi:hypothetical protein
VAFNGLAPLGCIPSQRVRSTDGKCLSHVNDYALEFNAAAKKLLDGLNAKLPGAQMGLADCYSVVMELIEHPEKNGNVLIDVSRECTASPLRRRAYASFSRCIYTYRRGRRRVHDGAHVVLQCGHGGRRAVPAQHEALQRPQRVRVLGRLPHLERRQQGDRRPPLGRHDERRARGRFGSSSRRRV